MSASNIFARRDGAWIAADTASYHDDGTILVIQSKIEADVRLRLAVAQSGRLAIDAGTEISRWLDRQSDQATALAGMPELLGLLSEHDAEAMGNGAAATSGLIPEGVRLMVAWWDAAEDRGRVATIATRDDGPAPAFTLRNVGTLFSPPIGADHWRAHSFDPATEALALAQQQRQFRDERGVVRVGGGYEVVRVHAGGIGRREVIRWPDRVGKPIRLDPEPSLAIRVASAIRDTVWRLKPRNRIWL